jgi:hypothetical protein
MAPKGVYLFVLSYLIEKRAVKIEFTIYVSMSAIRTTWKYLSPHSTSTGRVHLSLGLLATLIRLAPAV